MLRNQICCLKWVEKLNTLRAHFCILALFLITLLIIAVSNIHMII